MYTEPIPMGAGKHKTRRKMAGGVESQAGALSPLPAVTIGGIAATVSFAGLVEPGEFQFNVIVPAGLPSGDQRITASYAGSSTQFGTLITIQWAYSICGQYSRGLEERAAGPMVESASLRGELIGHARKCQGGPAVCRRSDHAGRSKLGRAVCVGGRGQGPGLDSLKDILRGMRTAFPDLNFAITEQISEGDKVASRFEWTGTHQGEFLGVPATGRPVRGWGIVIDRLEEGRIKDPRIIMDTFGLTMQLGVFPPPSA